MYKTYTLNNGLRIIHCFERTNVSYCGLIIDTGSRDELPSEYGMAHFVEHTIFKGTTKRKSAQIVNCLENIGGEIDAFTTKEESVIFACILNEYIEKAVEFIADIAQNPVFLQNEIDKEKEVIFDEINMNNDRLSNFIHNNFDEILFAKHSLAHCILGNKKNIEKFNTSDVFNFFKRQYVTEKMIFFILGNIELKNIVRLCEKYFEKKKKNGISLQRKAPNNYNVQTKNIKMNRHQTQVLIGSRAYDMYHPNRIGLHLLTYILGGRSVNSKLNVELREKHGLVYSVEANYQPFTDTGKWTIQFGCDSKNVEQCETLVYKELEVLRDKLIPVTALNSYKLQLFAQMAIAYENRKSMAINLGKNYLRHDKADKLNETRLKMGMLQANTLRDIANEMFLPQNFSTLRLC